MRTGTAVRPRREDEKGTGAPTAAVVPSAGVVMVGTGAAVPTQMVVCAVSVAPAASVTSRRTVRVPTES